MTPCGNPGAFSAIAATGAYVEVRNQAVPVAALLPLPVAVLVHASHDHDQYPVGVGVPRFVAGNVHLEAVLSSSAHRAWERVRNYSYGVSFVCASLGWYADAGVDVLARGVLTAVDLVDIPLDRGTRITSTRRALSEQERETQARFDRWLTRQSCPPGGQFFWGAVIDGPMALDELAEIVAPLTSDRQPGRHALAPASLVELPIGRQWSME